MRFANEHAEEALNLIDNGITSEDDIRETVAEVWNIETEQATGMTMDEYTEEMIKAVQYWQEQE